MEGICLKLFTTEAQRHHGKLLMEWLMEQAKELGAPGGTAYRAVAGFGRHGRFHEETFFELAGDLPVELEFLMSDAQVTAFLALLEREGLHLVYAKSPAEFGVVGSAERSPAE